MGSLRILLWKCWIVRKRRFIHTFFEFFSSLIILLVIFFLKGSLDKLFIEGKSEKLILRQTNPISDEKQRQTRELEYKMGYLFLGDIIAKGCCVALLINFTFFTTRLIEEKNSGIQELMKMVGVTANSLYLANLINALPGGLLYCVGGTGIMKMSSKPIFPNSSFVTIMLLLWLHFTSVMAFGCVVAYLLNTRRPTLVCTLVYICMMIIVPFALNFIIRSGTHIILVQMTGIFLNEPSSWFWGHVGVLETFGYGASFEYLLKMPELPIKNNKPCIGISYVWLAVQTILFLFVAWYLSHVRPGPFGEGQPSYFLCTKEWWSKNPTVEVIPPEDSEHNRPDPQFFEPSPKLPIGIQIIDVTKVFPRHVALSNVTLDVFKGEITLLLGHNGAGKTTLMNIISGLLTPTSGRVLINGIDTRSKRSSVRAQLGLCPQHNLFFPDLTVREHAMFFTLLKGGSRKTLGQYTTELLATLNLLDKAQSKPDQLSGGMQRRLQLACALAGGASVLVLDEPTSGLDVETRRELWDLLLRLRGSRTVLLTTHYMEEAEALADRVAALHSGALKCYATPLFLKKAIGGGYRLSFTTTGAPDEAAITAAITSTVPEASVRDRALKAISYNLPSKDSAQFPTLFTNLEAKKDKLGIVSIGVGKSTLDEVFLRLCSDVATTFQSDEVAAKLQVKVSNLKMELEDPPQEQQLNEPQFEAMLPRNTAVQPVHHTRYQAPADDGTLDLFLGYEDVGSNNPNYDAGFQSKQSRLNSDFKVIYDTDAYHAPVGMNLLSNVLARRAGASMTTKNHPLQDVYQPYDVEQKEPKEEFGALLWGLLTSVIMLVMLLENVSLPYKERVTGTRHIHQMCGCPLVLYWIVPFLFVLIKAVLFLLLPFVIGCFVLDENHTINNIGFIGAAIVALTLGILAFTAFTHVIATRMSLTTTNFIAFAAIFFFGFISPLVEYFTAVASDDEDGRDIYLLMILAVVPPHAMSMAFIDCGKIAILNAHCNLNKNLCPNLTLKPSLLLKYFDKDKCCASTGNYKSYFGLDHGAGVPMIALACQILFYFVWLILIDSGIFLRMVESLKKVKLHPTRFNDAIVKAEEAYVTQQIRKPKKEIEDAVLVYDLHKKYACFLCFREYMAVNRISFSVKKGECFGLLGINGAGKSTTFRVLNGECYPSHGKVLSCGHFFQERTRYMQTMSYCPQYFGLDDFLTGRENLNLVLTLRGFNSEDVREQTVSWIEEVGLMKYADRPVVEYSGGCGRRLAAAAALCQLAPVALLDEPTSGVDTAARRRLHSAILRAKRKKSIIVASHSMDEMEVLCDRVCIMSGGQVAALGSAAELRARHAQGFSALFKLLEPSRPGGTAAKAAGTTEVKAAGPPEKKEGLTLVRAQFIANMSSTFDCTIVDEHATQIQFHINNVMPYSELFAKMEALKQAFVHLIDDYIVSETTLEEVFLAFAKEAKREKNKSQAKN